ncbi:MAG: hypothetical protein ABL886_13665 [Rhodoglobus sp.]
MIAALIVFVAAAGLRPLVNSPGRYWGLSARRTLIGSPLSERGWGDKGEAAFLVGEERVVELRESMMENDRKAAAL